MALSCKNKLKFIDGSITKPSRDDQKCDVWERCNDLVISWIVRSVSPTIVHSVFWIDTTYGIWRDLKRRFSQQDLFRIAEIKWCECTTKCKCGKKIDELNEKTEKDKLSIFLIGLHDRYTGGRNQIMLMRPLPDVCDASL
ncbi:PREDICTED: uncharacterized protein LOC109179939 [Ipomoea nil]|uniref:uncharacterized protein LOC109179939 n=1 Tax=Ipomoea nil TaxID=35883 RepID=UPI000901165C|nr:PREDICTED: uncharacterized protein LOC109179939 [Ipomoea nil]